MFLKIANLRRNLSYLPIPKTVIKWPPYMEPSEDLAKNEDLALPLISAMTVYDNFVDVVEEKKLLEEIDPYMQRLRYEFSHWDDAIHGFRETERLKWNSDNTKIIDKVRKFAFPMGVQPLQLVHILDLAKQGYIKPHIDAVRFCGDTIAGLSLLSDSVMRMVHDKHPKLHCKVLLKRRSLYLMRDNARYDYKHEILKNAESKFKGNKIDKERRISIICRNKPEAVRE